MRVRVQSGPGPGRRHLGFRRSSSRASARRVGRPAVAGAVALLLGLSVAACGSAATPSPSPTPSPQPTIELLPTVAPTVEPAPTATPPATTIYVVKKGDTLIGIAKHLGVTLKALRAANPEVTDPTKLQIGQKLVVPAP